MAVRATNPQQPGIIEHRDAESFESPSCLQIPKTGDAGIILHWPFHETSGFLLPGLSRVFRIREEAAA